MSDAERDAEGAGGDTAGNGATPPLQAENEIENGAHQEASDEVDQVLDLTGSTAAGNNPFSTAEYELNGQATIRKKFMDNLDHQIDQVHEITRSDRGRIAQNRFYLQGQSKVIQRLAGNVREQGNKILTLVNEDAFDQEMAFQSECDLAIEACLAEIDAAIDSISIPNNLPAPPTALPDPPKPSFKLPAVQIQPFSGKITDWTSFYDLFTATIGKNKTLSDAEKFYYLKTLLTGDAAKLISALQLTNSNYPVALQALKDRYENKRLIIRSHVKALNSVPAVQTECGQQLRRLIESYEENIQSLYNVCNEKELLNALLVNQVLEKLDQDTRKAWELQSTGDKGPTYSELKNFIQKRATALEASNKAKAGAGNTGFKNSPVKAHFATPNKNDQVSANFQNCILACNESHRLHQCPKFTAMKIEERQKTAKDKRLCFNCLTQGHSLKDCKSKHTCRECNGLHHSLLHRSSAKPVQPNAAKAFTTAVEESEEAFEEPECSSHHINKTYAKNDVVLATAMIPIKTDFGQVPCRALLDEGSNRCFITTTCLKRLKLPYNQAAIPIGGLGGTNIATSKGYANLTICPPFDTEIELTALAMDTVTSPLPSQNFSTDGIQAMNQVKLADPAFNVKSKIDLLIGSDILQDLYLNNRIKVHPRLALVETKLGYVLSGNLVDPRKESSLIKSEKEAQNLLCLAHRVSAKEENFEENAISLAAQPTETLDKQLEKFWEIEEFPQKQHYSPNEQFFVDHYNETTTRDPDGRFRVDMPFLPGAPKLGNSYKQALRRLKCLEYRLDKHPGLRQKYNDFVQEFIDLDHLEKVPASELEIEDEKSFYLPHHCVFKEDSTTTKLRVVFDGSAKTSSGVSLNDVIANGPKIQDDLYEILLRFRLYKIALSADVAKMYRQTALTKEAKDFHRLLWRFNSSDPIETYRMTRVTYGIRSSGFHSTNSLQKCSEGQPEPIANRLKHDFNVDDFLGGAENISEARYVRDGLNVALSSGGMELRKWSSSESELVMELSEKLREHAEAYTFTDENHTVKTLGLVWYPSKDCFAFKIEDAKLINSKRGLLSDAAKLYDPIGWLSPIVVKFKILIQRSWQANIQWDTPLPDDLYNEWSQAREELLNLNDLELPRCILKEDYQEITLHIFCDASEVAYAACAYLCVVYPDRVESNLLTAKTRVAPVKRQSLPRLELCAALLGSNLITAVLKALEPRKITLSAIEAWSDSTIVLAWLKEPPSSWTTFVANRVSKIQEILPLENWHYVSSSDNPADIASRGIDIAFSKQLISHELWWKGPEWLISSDLQLEKDNMTGDILPEEVIERKKKTPTAVAHAVLSVEHSDNFIDIKRFSSLSKFKNTLGYVTRFIDNLKNPKSRKTGPPTPNEYFMTFSKCVALQQAIDFPALASQLRGGTSKHMSPEMSRLSPFIDEQNLIRVGGRLMQSNLPDDKKHPILLKPGSDLAQLIIRHSHLKCLHSGTQSTLSDIRQNFWIIDGKNAVKKLIRKCSKCFRFASTPVHPQMAHLPEERISKTRPFTNVGLDFAGPFFLKTTRKEPDKAYLALFICFATKAVHLEAVSALTTEACIAALRRFISRRGMPQVVFSDNGTNFQGARNELENLRKILNDSSELSVNAFAHSSGIEWVMIPPRAPHFGGLWEAAIKSAKNLLKRTIGNTPLNFEELATIFTQIEAVLNSRPITDLSSDANDLQPLTPGHFLIGAPITILPHTVKDTEKIPIIKRWKLLQQLFGNFWNRWSKEYLTQLQERKKWTKKDHNFKIGELVLIAEDNQPPAKWKMGRILKVFEGNDKIVRTVQLKTLSGTYVRPVVKLRLLPCNLEE